MTHVCFSGFAFATCATTAFDTLHDSFALGARKWKQTYTVYVLLLASCL